jgi:hypothetical protein
MLCSCPVGTAIDDITAYTCPVDVREIQKIAFWRTGNHIDTVALLITLATWTTMKSAADGTHVVVTPFLNNPRFEGGDVITFGGGTETRNGNPEVVGMNPTKFTINAIHWSSAQKRNMKDLMCEQLDAIFINNEGKFIHTLATGGIIVEGFPVQSFYISDRKVGNRITPDLFEISFTLAEGWDDYLTITDPTAAFNALTL